MPFFIDVFHGFYRTAIVPTFIDIVPFLINIVPTNNLFLLKSGPDIASLAYSCHHHHSCSTFTSIISNIIIKYIVILNHIPHHHVPLYHHHINIALLTRHVFSQWGEHKEVERTIIKTISISDIIIMIMSLSFFIFITILVRMFPPRRMFSSIGRCQEAPECLLRLCFVWRKFSC